MPFKPLPIVPPHRPTRQRAFVLPTFVALMLIVLGVFFFTLNANQANIEKTRTSNAADAAAYSAATLEARALNFDALMNRAIVANQMAIAQMISFASWIDYFARGADNIASSITDIEWFTLPDPRVIPLEIAFVGTEAASLYFTERQVRDYAKYVIEALGALITIHDVASTSLALTQQLVHINMVAGFAQGEVARAVVREIDPDLDAEVLLVSRGFDFFTRSMSGDDRARLKQVVMDSRDPFTLKRSWDICSFDIPFVRSDGCLKKRGGTDLVGFDEWRAVDTLEVHGRRFGCGRFGLSWCDDIRRPVAWGAIHASNSRRDRGQGEHGGAYRDNPTTAALADRDMQMPRLAMYSGLPSVRDIAELDPASSPVTGVTVLVSKPHAKLLTSGGAATAKPTGRLQRFDDQPAGGELISLARAEIFFDRITPRADGKSELASLYNPYWRVRLVPPLLVDRAAAAIRQGIALP